MNQDYINIIKFYGSDILNSKNMEKQKEYIQHGNISVYEHSLRVAYLSIKIVSKFHLRVNMRSLIRGALLHDYFLYDWHDKEHINPFRLHGFFHPGIALKNARAEYELTEREQEIIRKHMWPLTVVPPMCREAWIVTAADKWVSLMETLHIHKGNKTQTVVDKEISA